jgi:hypothetical protein
MPFGLFLLAIFRSPFLLFDANVPAVLRPAAEEEENRRGKQVVKRADG